MPAVIWRRGRALTDRMHLRDKVVTCAHSDLAVTSTDGDSAVQADRVMPLAKACLGSEMNGAQRLHFFLI